MMLPVSGPFHSALMQPAADVMAEALAKVTVKPPSVPLVANVLAQPITDPGEIVRGLVEQVTGNVRWRESIAFMAQAGVTTFYEVGSGKVLSGLVKRIAEGATGVADRHAGGCRRLQGVARLHEREAVRTHVRSDRQDALCHRRDRRHRRRDRARAASAGRHRCPLGHARARRSISSPRELSERVHVLPCDLADKDAVEALVPKAEEAMGKLDILVANAGITRDNLLVQLSDQAWDEVIAVNLTATFRLARAAVTHHDAPPLRPHHRHHLGRRRHRQSRAGQLYRRQGRHDRHDEIDRRRICQARRDRQLHRAGLYRERR